MSDKANPQLYCLKCEVSITLRYQLRSTHYTAVLFKKCLCYTKYDFHHERKPSHAITKLTL